MEFPAWQFEILLYLTALPAAPPYVTSWTSTVTLVISVSIHCLYSHPSKFNLTEYFF